jgi:8-oxo-dGTP diphosphatase
MDGIHEVSGSIPLSSTNLRQGYDWHAKNFLRKIMQEKQPRVGVGVMIFKDNKILLGKRKGSHGPGEWAFPGGHLDYMETFEECVIRETKEESGLEIKNIQFVVLKNTHLYAPKHYVHIGMVAEWKSGEAQILEPNKCQEWKWFALDSLPHPLFEPCKWTLDSYKTGQHYLQN